MYLPAFPAVEASFGTEPGTAQLTLATWFAGLAVGQITQGTLSDRFGRRIPLMIGFIVFTLATIGCAPRAHPHHAGDLPSNRRIRRLSRHGHRPAPWCATYRKAARQRPS